jgi:hypothetical protein
MDGFVANPTSEPTLKPTIIFVPFFGGKSSALQRHIAYVKELGYPYKFVDLTFDLLAFLKHPISARTHRFGMKATWSDQIENVLNQTPGKKIIFSFSNPTAGAIEAIVRRNAQDILGLIADSGPSGEVWTSIFHYYSLEKPLPTWFLKAAATTFSSLVIEPDFKHFAHADLEKMPAGFPILSIRGWKDPLISPRQIDMIFEPHSQLQWQKLSLPEGGHLNGLRDFSTDYKAGVERFLTLVTKNFSAFDGDSKTL